MVSKKSKNLFITNLSKGNPEHSGLPFDIMKEAILGKRYVLSLAFVSKEISRELNKKYRAKNKPTNILSFPFSKTEGEIIINLEQVKKDAPLFEKNYKEFLGLLFIHGLLHLKGFDHGSIMESREEYYLNRFKI